ncbi:enoyl-CoA hydratase/isomerase family protein [Limnochorda pilosa]|uniref:Enoyl-CoA hydratase n=1 Tax=Limnochorda pilosa TaxID=1555112 RepID=A0A0K2SQC6_LIMPI|nr:enoyl-CoA hydratase/isomerase family protein [Limnochorda pilosa]BAS29034.1 enoyl-CoA hydratase [Limnochorda pilosa]
MDEPVRLAVAGGIARITLDRPEQRNALNRATCRALVRAFERAGADPGVRVVLLRGAGEQAFCAGADLKELAEIQADADAVLARRAYFGGVADCIRAMEESPVPVVGMVFGHALGGGLGLAAACDILYVADDAHLGLPELGIGLFPMVVMAPILRSVGRKKAMELIFGAGLVNGAEAEQMGLATRAFPRERLEEETERLLARVASFSPAVLRVGREAAARIDGLSVPQALGLLREAITVASSTEDARRGVTSYLERRNRP